MIVKALIGLHEIVGGKPIALKVDGGVKANNIGAIAAAGADTFVAGSAIFGARDADGGYWTVMGEFRRKLAGEASAQAAS